MSNKSEALNGFYSKVLLDVGIFDADGEGMLSYHDGSTPKPVTISKRRLVLPIRNILRDGDWTTRIPFHPLSEQLNQGPSPVLNAFKNYIVERIKGTVREMCIALMDVAIEPKRHKKLSHKAAQFLSGLTDPDQKSHDTLRKVLDAVGPEPERHLITLFLKNGGAKGDLRSCFVSFPILDDAHNDDPLLMFGVKMPRKTKDKANCVAVLEYVLGNQEERAEYSTGSADGEAPYFHSLLLTFNKLAKRLNDLIDIHEASCPQLVGFKFNLDWQGELDTFSSFAKTNGPAAPALPGNRGVDSDVERKNAYESGEDDVGDIDTRVERESNRRDRDDDDVEPARREESGGGLRRSWREASSGRRDERDDDRDRDRSPGRREREQPRHRSWRDVNRDDHDDRRDDRRDRGRSSLRRGW